MPATLWCQSRITVATVGWQVARLAVPLTGLVWFSPPASFAADTSPHWMTSVRSSWPVFLRGPDLGNSECRSLRGHPRHSGLFRTPDRQVNLFVAQGLSRLKLGGPVGRQVTEEHARQARYQERHHHGQPGNRHAYVAR